MTSLGVLTVTLRLDSQLAKQLNTEISAIKDFTKKIEGASCGAKDQWFKDNRGLVSATSDSMESIKKTWDDGTKTIIRGANQMGEGMQKGSKMGIMAALSFQSMIGKIVHYVTFSIGVQMVQKLRDGISSIVTSFADFERAATNAAAVTGVIGASFDETKKHIMDVSKYLGRTTIFSALEVAKAFYNLASAGYDVSDMTTQEFLPIINYATAHQVDLEEATYAVCTALKEYNLDMSDAGRVTDIFTKAITTSFQTFERLKEGMKYVGTTAGILGISLEETVAALTVLVDRGTEGGQAGQRLNMIFTRLLDPTTEGEEVLSRYGLTLEDINPEANSLVEILYKLRAAGFDTADSMGMFRARTAASMAALVDNADAVARYTTLLEQSSGSTEEMAKKQSETLWASLQEVKNAFIESSVSIGESLAPSLMSLTEIIRGFADSLKGIIGFLMKMAPIILTLIKVWLTYKIAMFALTTAYKVYMAYQKLHIFLNNLSLASFKKLIVAKVTDKNTTQALTASTGALTGAVSANMTMVNGNTTALWSFTTAEGAATVGAHALKAALISTGILALVVVIGMAVSALMDMFTSTKKVAAIWKTLGPTLDDWSGYIDIGVASTYIAIKGNVSLTESLNRLTDVYGYSKDEVSDYYKSLASSSEGLVDPIKNIVSPFGLLGAGLGMIIPQIKDINQALLQWGADLIGQGDALKDFFTNVPKENYMRMIGLTEDQIVNFTEAKQATLLLSTEMTMYNEALKEVSDAVNEEIIAEQKLNEVKSKASIGALKNNNDLLNAESDALKATDKRVKAQQNLLNTTRNLLNEMRKFSVSVDTGLGYMEEWASATAENADNQLRLQDIMDQSVDITEKLANAISEYGVNSKEAVSAERELMNVAKERAELESDIADLTDKADQALKNRDSLIQNGIKGEYTLNELHEMGFSYEQIRQDLIKGDSDAYEELKSSEDKVYNVELALTTVEKVLLEIGSQVITQRNAEVEALNRKLVAEAKIEALNLILTRTTTILSEKMKTYLEIIEKIRNEEEKLYKLRYGEDEQLESLFDKMAEEGLVNKDTIDAFVRLENAEGGVLGLNYEFSESYKQLTDDQKKLVMAYISGADEADGTKVTLEELEDAGVKNIDTFKKYKSAQDELADATKDFKDLLGPMIDDWEEVGAVSPEVASAWGDIADNALETVSANLALAIANSQLDDSMASLITTSANLALALQDKSGEELSDVYLELLERLGILDDMGGDTASVLENLNKLWGTHYRTLEEFAAHDEGLGESQMMASTALIQGGVALNVWSQGMEASNIATLLGVTNLESLTNAADIAYDEEESLVELQKDLAEATTEFTNAVTKLSESLAMLVKIAAGENILGVSLQFDFSALATSMENDIQRIFYNMNVEGADLTADMFQSWADQDWTSLADLMADPANKALVDSLTPMFTNLGIDPSKLIKGIDWKKAIAKYLGMDISKLTNEEEWNKAWKDILKTGSEGIKKLNSIFRSGEVLAYITTEWPEGGETFNDWLSKLRSNLPMVNSVLSASGLEIPMEALVDDMAFSEYLSNLKSEDLTNLQNALITSNVLLPVGSEDLFTTAVLGARDELQVNLDSDNPKVKVTESEDSELQSIIDKINTLCNNIHYVDLVIRQNYEEPTKKPEQYIITPMGAIPTSVLEDRGKSSEQLWKEGKIGQKGLFVKGPTQALIGEAGAEAVIPLEGKNKKYGENILRQIIPQYFPGLKFMQTGGIVGGTDESEGVRTSLGYLSQIDGTLKLIYGIIQNLKDQTISILNSLLANTASTITSIDNLKSSLTKLDVLQTISSDIKLFTSILNAGFSALNTNIANLSQILVVSKSTTGGGGSRGGGTTGGTTSGTSGGSWSYQDVKDAGLNGVIGSRYWQEEDGTWDLYVKSASGAEKLVKRDKDIEVLRKYYNDNYKNTNVSWKTGGIVDKPTFGMFGEKGAEAIIPLEGANRKFGAEILKSIIPSYYPDLYKAQQGGIFGATSTNSNVTYGGDTYNDNMTMSGPITVNNPANFNAFMEQLKMKSRTSKR